MPATTTRVNLSPQEAEVIIKDRTQGKPAVERTGYVGLVSFRGPRGRRYRNVRTALYLPNQLDRCAAEAERIRHKPYANGAYAVGEELLEVNSQGEVVA